MNVPEHEAKLRVINQKFMDGSLSREEAQTAIADLLGENNLAFRLKEALEREVNGEISFKSKEHLNDRAYFLKRNEIEDSVINSDFPFAFFQESTLSEIEQLNPT